MRPQQSENIYHPKFLCDILVRKLDLIQNWPRNASTD